jgi:hypothetical protein
MPEVVEGTSLSTLSVAMSNMVSSWATASPGFLCHFKMVASIILSPNLGIIKSIMDIFNRFKLNKIVVLFGIGAAKVRFSP